jgi:carbon storage regulator
MLVLSRKSGQRVMIGNDVVVSILEVRGSTIRLGIEAPRSLPVHREEVLLREAPDTAELIAVELAC